MLKKFNLDKRLTAIGIVYFIVGVVFAVCYALFYHWGFLSFLSPGFFAVALTWPIQFPGFLWDFQLYGLTGKELI